MTSSTYTQARQQLNQVLSADVFRPRQQRTPWWMPVWHWIEHHVHWSGRFIPWHAVSILSIVLAAALVCFVVWRFMSLLLRRSRAVWTPNHHRPRSLSLWLERATESYHRQDYPQMLADLIDACVRFAADRNWWAYHTADTSRAYQVLARKVPSPAFQSVFTELVNVAEHVRYAGEVLDRETAEAWLNRVKAMGQGGSQ